MRRLFIHASVLRFSRAFLLTQRLSSWLLPPDWLSGPISCPVLQSGWSVPRVGWRVLWLSFRRQDHIGLFNNPLSPCITLTPTCVATFRSILEQRGDLGVPVSVMDMAVVSAMLAFAEVCCPPLGSVRPVLLSPHILLARRCCCKPCFLIWCVCACVCVGMCVSVRARERKRERTCLFACVQRYQITLQALRLLWKEKWVWSNVCLIDMISFEGYWLIDYCITNQR